MQLTKDEMLRRAFAKIGELVLTLELLAEENAKAAAADERRTPDADAPSSR